MFGLKSESLLAFDTISDSKFTKYNLQSLYKLEHTPSDTYMRERLDVVDPQLIRPLFVTLFNEIQRGKLLESYKFLNGYLLAVDGTQMFESKKVFCNHCCKKEFKNNEKPSYYHQVLAGSIVHPNIKQGIPLCPEPIIKQDGITKNDCESNAMRRFLQSLKQEHPKLKTTVVADALYGNAPTIGLFTELGYDYIINAKPSANKSLYEWISGLTLNTTTMVVEKNKYIFRYINNIPLNNTKNAPETNFLECISEEVHGNKISKKTFS